MLRFEAEVDHLNAWHEHALNHAPQHVCCLTWLQSYAANQRANYRETKRILEEAIRLFDQKQVGGHELEANLFDDISRIEYVLEEFPVALSYAEKALAIKRKLFGEESAEAAMTLLSLRACLKSRTAS